MSKIIFAVTARLIKFPYAQSGHRVDLKEKGHHSIKFYMLLPDGLLQALLQQRRRAVRRKIPASHTRTTNNTGISIRNIYIARQQMNLY